MTVAAMPSATETVEDLQRSALVGAAGGLRQAGLRKGKGAGGKVASAGAHLAQDCRLWRQMMRRCTAAAAAAQRLVDTMSTWTCTTSPPNLCEAATAAKCCAWGVRAYLGRLVIVVRPYRLRNGRCAQHGSQRVAAEGAGTRATRAGAIAPPLTRLPP